MSMTMQIILACILLTIYKGYQRCGETHYGGKENGMIKYDFWYGHKREDVTEITVTFYPNDGKYRGWLKRGTQIIGDYVADDSVALEREFARAEENEMEELYKAEEILKVAYPQVSEIKTSVAFKAFLGTLVDTWGADHGMDSEEVCEMVDMLATVQKQIHEDFGGVQI